MIALKLAFRNLLRNRWRSGLTLAGVAVAVGLMVWTLAFYEGWIVAMVRGATAVDTGELQLQTAGWAENPRVYQSLVIDDDLFAAVTRVPGVGALTPRLEAHGLVGNEERSRVARVVGVDPAREARATPVMEGLRRGRWLGDVPAANSEPREVVLGDDLADQLRVATGAELVVFLEAADGSLGNDVLRVVGTVRTGNTEVDRSAAFLHLADAQHLTALEGRAHALLVRTDDPGAARATAAAVATALGARVGAPGTGEDVPEETLVVRPWQELAPSLDQMILLFRRSYWFMYLVVYLVAAVGILNTQRMSALERRREFGVLKAVGMRPARLFRTLQVETVTLGVAGALLGALLGGLLAWHHATAGFDMTRLSDHASFSYMGVAFSDRLYFELTTAAIVQPVLVMVAVALVSGLVPALTAAQIDPAPTIAGRT